MNIDINQLIRDAFDFELVRIDVMPGAHISLATKRAIIVAVIFECPVEFVFNGKTYTVSPSDLWKCVQPQRGGEDS